MIIKIFKLNKIQWFFIFDTSLAFPLRLNANKAYLIAFCYLEESLNHNTNPNQHCRPIRE